MEQGGGREALKLSHFAYATSLQRTLKLIIFFKGSRDPHKFSEAWLYYQLPRALRPPPSPAAPVHAGTALQLEGSRDRWQLPKFRRFPLARARLGVTRAEEGRERRSQCPAAPQCPSAPSPHPRLSPVARASRAARRSGAGARARATAATPGPCSP